MEVFISWSGDQSRAVAEALSKALRHIVRDATTFVSTHDIDPGARWETQLSEAMEKSNHGVLCVTQENQSAPWLNYEAGALGKILGRSKVIPYTLGFPPNDLRSGPLTRFQGVQNDKHGTWSLVQSLSRSSSERADENFIREDFEKWWPDLDSRMTQLLASPSPIGEKSSPSEREIILEIRDAVRLLLDRGPTTYGAGEAIELLERLLRDPLTRLPNRRAFTDRINELAANNARYVIAFLDLDDFKRINDEFGHARGDEVLVAVAKSMKARLSGADFIARFGGEEFLAIFLETPRASVQKALAELILALPQDMLAAGLPAVTASCGVSSDRVEAGDAKLRDADTAMYGAKRAGGGQVILSD